MPQTQLDEIKEGMEEEEKANPPSGEKEKDVKVVRRRGRMTAE